MQQFWHLSEEEPFEISERTFKGEKDIYVKSDNAFILLCLEGEAEIEVDLWRYTLVAQRTIGAAAQNGVTSAPCFTQLPGTLYCLLRRSIPRTVELLRATFLPLHQRTSLCLLGGTGGGIAAQRLSSVRRCE